jgi:hypothetical protein
MLLRNEPLTHALFRIAIARRDQPVPLHVTRRLARAQGAEWEQTERALAPHKIFPLLAHQLSHFDLLEVVPAETRARLLKTYQETRVMNGGLMVCAATALRALAKRGEHPLAMKGVIFANDLYPDVATRPMGDIDLVAAQGRHEALLEVLKALGYQPAPVQPQDDAVIMVLPSGVRCDAHKALRMFDGEDWHLLTRETELARMKGVSVRMLEPSAMVAHLATHMGGHYDEVGPVLLWITDLIFVLRRFASEVDVARIARLTQSDRHWTLLLRMLVLLQDLDEPIPEDFKPLLSAVPPLSLAHVLRQRRTTPWGLPGPKGFLRFAAQRLSLRDYRQRPALSGQDLLWCGVDTLAERLIERRIRRPD